MINVPTVFVLGAGASRPYGLPLGAKLVRDVIAALGPENSALRRALWAADFRHGEADRLYNDLSGARPSSIDRFLTRRPALRDVGKAAMAGTLLPMESDDALVGVDDKEDWYAYLFDELFGNSLDDYYSNQLSIVTFNFDRSFERALHRALQWHFEMTPTAAATATAAIPVIHVHGSLGAASWLTPDDANALPYGPVWRVVDVERTNEVSGDDITKCLRSIRLFSEDCRQSALEDALKALAAAERVCFLGFSYQADNVRKLQCETWWRNNRLYHGTALGMEDGERSAAVARFPPGFEVMEENCRTFFRKTNYIFDQRSK